MNITITRSSDLEDTTLNSDKKHSWNCLKSMDDSVKQKVTPEISEENWLRHFQSIPTTS